MKKYLVLYYTNTGNSKFIAEKLAVELKCDVKKIAPFFGNAVILFILSTLRINVSTNISIADIRKYDEVIILGPIWAGQLISPLRTALNLCVKALKNTHFAVTCETKEEEKDSKYGYNQVLKKASDLSSKYVKSVAAFSTSLVDFDNKPSGTKSSEKIKITEDNYSAVLKDRVENFAMKIKAT